MSLVALCVGGGSLVFYNFVKSKIIRIINNEIDPIRREVANLRDEYLQIQLNQYYKSRGDDLNRFYVNDGYRDANAYIAHGSGIDEFTYTNSKEGIEDSLNKKKFRFIEIDMIETSDHKVLGGA